MANEQNLIRNEDLTPQERRERASKAGKASVEARRKRKTLREELLALLEKGEYQEKISTALIGRAMTGDTKAYEVIRDTIGEKPTDKVENKNENVNMTYEEYLKKVSDSDEY